MADITRNQFDESKAVLQKITQQDHYVSDADFNEMSEISHARSARTLYDMINPVGGKFRIGTSWAMTGGSNQVSISAGDAMFAVLANRAYLFYLPAGATVTGFTTPSGSNRTDYIYLDVEFDEVNAVEDATLINPAIGYETAVDIRLKWSIQKAIGVAVPTAPAGHYYITIATIARTNGVATIAVTDITNHILGWQPLGEVLLYTEGRAAPLGSNTTAPTALSGGTDNDSTRVFCVPQEGTETYYVKVVGPCFKTAKFNKIKARFIAKSGGVFSADGYIRFTVNGFTALEFLRAANATYTYHEMTIDVTSAAVNADLNWKLELKSQQSGEIHVTKLRVVGVME